MLPAVGDRIELLSMPDDPSPIESGTTGTVTEVSGPHDLGDRPIYQVSVEWDAPRRLMLCIPPDRVRVIGRA